MYADTNTVSKANERAVPWNEGKLAVVSQGAAASWKGRWARSDHLVLGYIETMWTLRCST